MVSEKSNCKIKKLTGNNCRNYLFSLSKKNGNPAILEELTAYCPYEGMNLIKSKVVQNYHNYVFNLEPPHKIDTVLLLPCSEKKPYFLSRNHKEFFKNMGMMKNPTNSTEFQIGLSKEGTFTIEGKKVYLCVVSEPLAIVPYFHVYPDPRPPVHQYDCPAFFRDNSKCSWIPEFENTIKQQKRYWHEGLSLLGEISAKILQNWFENNEMQIISLCKTKAHNYIIGKTKELCPNYNFINLLDEISLEERCNEIFTKGNSKTIYKPFPSLTLEEVIKLIKREKSSKKNAERKIQEATEAFQIGRDSWESYLWNRAKGSAKVSANIKPYSTKLIKKKLKKHLGQ
jgi:hypothetical protein